MSNLVQGPSIQGIGTAIDDAAKTLRDPSSTVPLEDIAKKLVTDIAKAIDPNLDPNITLNNLRNNNINDKSDLLLGAHAAIFRLGLNMAFSGIPTTPAQSRNFTNTLMNIAGPAIEEVFKQASLPGGDIFRAWKN